MLQLVQVLRLFGDVVAGDEDSRVRDGALRFQVQGHGAVLAPLQVGRLQGGMEVRVVGVVGVHVHASLIDQEGDNVKVPAQRGIKEGFPLGLRVGLAEQVDVHLGRQPKG